MLLSKRSNIKILLKKPKKGGTPAKENKKIVKIKIKKLSKPNMLNEYKVFSGLFNTDKNTQKKPIRVAL